MSEQNGKYDASVWQSKTHDLPLSKGMVLVQEIDVLSMIVKKDGSIPDTLQHFLKSKFIEGGSKVAVESAAAKSEDLWEQLPDLVPFIDMVCEAALVKPRIVNTIEDASAEILISMLPLPDRMAIFSWVFDQMGDLEALNSFRGEQSGSVFAGRDGATIRDTAE